MIWGMPLFSRLHRLIAMIALITALQAETGSARERSMVLELPCREVAAASSDSSLNSCGEGSLPLCKELKDKLTQNLKKHFDFRKKCLYEGVELSFNETKTEGRCEGEYSPLPMCDLVEGEIAQSKTGKQRDCGPFGKVLWNGILRQERDGIPYGMREKSYFDGVIARSMSCTYQNVVDEVSRSGKLVVSETCMAAAEKYHAQIKNFCTLQDNNIERDCNFNSDGVDLTEVDVSGTQEKAKHRYGACKAAEDRHNLESSFFNLMACEWLTRAQKGHESAVKSEEAQKRVAELIKKDVVTHCVNKNYKNCDAWVTGICSGIAKNNAERCKKKLKDPKSCAEREVKRTLAWCIPQYERECTEWKGNECYPEKFPEVFGKYLEERLPNDGKCQLED